MDDLRWAMGDRRIQVNANLALSHTVPLTAQQGGAPEME